MQYQNLLRKTFYAQINYFLVYKFMNQERMLANVKWANEVNEDALGMISFLLQLIDV
jgi:hypothetical protein